MSRSFKLIPAVLMALMVSSTVEARRASIPLSTVPYLEPDEWPYVVETDHFVVHYHAADELETALLVAEDVEHAWSQHVDVLGSPPPLGDAWDGDPDPRLDVFLWRGIDTMYVDEVVEAEPVTDPDIDDAATYLVLDPWGQYGLGVSEAELRANIYHELRHAIQARFDWWEDYWLFEAEATFWEARSAAGFARLGMAWADYQAHPDWSPFLVDDYRTWYMYGGALYFDFLSHRYFDGGLAFANAMWARCENPPGAELDPLLNEPDFGDALDELLAAEGTTFVQSVVAFARARWYTGARAGAGSFTEPSVIPEVAARVHSRGGGTARTTERVDAMMLGTSYVTVARGARDPDEIFLSLRANGQGDATHAVQLVGRGAGDRLLDLASGRARLRFDASGRAHLAVTVLPPAGAVYDPDAAGAARHSVTLVFER